MMKRKSEGKMKVIKLELLQKYYPKVFEKLKEQRVREPYYIWVPKDSEKIDGVWYATDKER